MVNRESAIYCLGPWTLQQSSSKYRAHSETALIRRLFVDRSKLWENTRETSEIVIIESAHDKSDIKQDEQDMLYCDIKNLETTFLLMHPLCLMLNYRESHVASVCI